MKITASVIPCFRDFILSLVMAQQVAITIVDKQNEMLLNTVG